MYLLTHHPLNHPLTTTIRFLSLSTHYPTNYPQSLYKRFLEPPQISLIPTCTYLRQYILLLHYRVSRICLSSNSVVTKHTYSELASFLLRQRAYRRLRYSHTARPRETCVEGKGRGAACTMTTLVGRRVSHDKTGS